MSQVLQPGSVPAWDGDTPASSIDDVFANETWPVLSQMLIYPYANAAARDAELAGLLPTATAYAYLKDVKKLTYWTGTGWGWVGGRRTSGAVTIASPTPGSPNSVNVTFPVGMFTSTPNVQATANTTVPGSIVLGVGVSGVTTTGCIIWACRNNTSSTAVNWVATQDD